MKVIDCIQGDDVWIESRLGIPTASEFHRIVTPKGKLSTQSTKYAYRLIAEYLLKRSMDSLEGLEWIEFGKANEADAARLYEFDHEVESIKVGFVTTDDGKIGCSPDRLVGDKGLLEIKSVAPQTHIGNMVNGFDEDYICQVQGQLYVSEREWCDWISYNPEFPLVCIRTYRNEEYIKLLADSLKAFNEMKDEMLEKIKVKGFFAERKVLNIAEATYGEQLNVVS